MIGRKRLLACRLDGVLVDNDRLRVAAHMQTVIQFGGSISFEDSRRLMGMPDAEMERVIRERAGIPDRHRVAYANAFREKFWEMMPLAKPFPGVIETLERLRGNIHIVVVSWSDQETMHRTARATGIDQVVSRLVPGDVIGRPWLLKRPYERLLFAMGTLPEECVILEGTDAGCRLAAETGSSILAFRHDFNAREELPSHHILTRFDPDEVVAAIGSL